MPILQAKARSWEAFVAGFGASGALMAGAFVVFVGLIGMVTFNTWPHAGSLFGGLDGDIGLNSAAASRPAPAGRPGTLNRVKPIGGRQGQETRHRDGGGSSNLPIGNGGLGGSNRPPGGSGGGPTPVEVPPSPPTQSPSPPTQLRDVVGQAVSDAGNTVESGTDSLGGTVNAATGTSAGDVVSNLGDTLNNGLQSLTGKR
jgi:hypothetical protein